MDNDEERLLALEQNVASLQERVVALEAATHLASLSQSPSLPSADFGTLHLMQSRRGLPMSKMGVVELLSMQVLLILPGESMRGRWNVLCPGCCNSWVVNQRFSRRYLLRWEARFVSCYCKNCFRVPKPTNNSRKHWVFLRRVSLVSSPKRVVGSTPD